MDKNLLQLDFILNIDNFEKIQDSIADLTGFAIVTVDYKGIPVTRHSRCSAFCKIVREHPELRALCEKCDSRGGLEAVRNLKPYFYRCHMGILDFAVPIIVNNQYLGAIMAGQVLVGEEEELQLEQIVSCNERQKARLNLEQFKKAYDNLPVKTLVEVKTVAETLSYISNYIVEAAYTKIQLSELNNSIIDYNKSNLIRNIELKQTREKYSVEESNLHKYQLPKINIILKPAIDFINENYHKNIKLNEMASLCNVSISYFSRLFTKTTGRHFASYINEKRISKARSILESTDYTIAHIAMDLGFEDSGYFSKVFKKEIGVTPSEYRRVLTRSAIKEI